MCEYVGIIGITIAASYTTKQDGKNFIIVYLRNDTQTLKTYPRVGRDSGFSIGYLKNDSLMNLRDEDPTARTIQEKLVPNILRKFRIYLNPAEVAQLAGQSIIISTNIYDPSSKVTFSVATNLWLVPEWVRLEADPPAI